MEAILPGSLIPFHQDSIKVTQNYSQAPCRPFSSIGVSGCYILTKCLSFNTNVDSGAYGHPNLTTKDFLNFGVTRTIAYRIKSLKIVLWAS